MFRSDVMLYIIRASSRRLTGALPLEFAQSFRRPLRCQLSVRSISLEEVAGMARMASTSRVGMAKCRPHGFAGYDCIFFYESTTYRHP